MNIDTEYYSGYNQNMGFVFEGLWDFQVNGYKALKLVEQKPASVIDIGGARGYTVKILADLYGIPAIVMEKSPHCYHTRAVKDFCLHDLRDVPYPFTDKQFDIAYSNAVLEHTSYEMIDDIIREMARISNRGYHAIGFKGDGTDGGLAPDVFFSDGTHVIYESQSWWVKKFDEIAPWYPVTIVSDQTGREIAIPVLKNDLLKLNIGCGTNLFGSGWVNMDINQKIGNLCPPPYKFEKYDARTPIPYDDNSVDLIFLGNILECLEFRDASNLISECYRVLKGNGIVRVSTTDSELLMRKYLRGELDFLKHIYPDIESAPCDIAKLSCAMFSYESGTMYDRCLMMELFKMGGFVGAVEANAWDSVNQVMAITTHVSYPTISFVMEAKK